MSSAAGLLVLLSLGMARLVVADDTAPAAKAATDAPAAAVAPVDAVPAPDGGKEPAIPASITVVADPMALTPEEKEFLSRGYKLEIRQGTKFFCRREQQIGSRFETKTCSTGDALRAQQASAEEALRRIQSNRPSINN
jgi:hypothetical protein